MQKLGEVGRDDVVVVHGEVFMREEEDLKKRSLYELLDENFNHVANSFEEFLNLIYPDDED